MRSLLLFSFVQPAERLCSLQGFLLLGVMTFSTLIASCFILIAAWIAAYPVLCRWLPDAWTFLKRLCG